MKIIIFDLDLTPVNTNCLEEMRNNQNWLEEYKLIPQTYLYEGINQVVEIIRNNNIKTAIVSTAPYEYVHRIVKY